ncbi:methyltransferase [Paenibacillus tepidiphilus]|uniref:methyltransferase n=1 Tax=Paenibacillus tepidiphilus TaxID=2608683 RepID=UPI001EF0E356|nr:methyltransferase [Paenibacillus tepidiphilus]
MLKSLQVIEAYRRREARGETPGVAVPWLAYIASAEQPVVNLERVESLRELDTHNPVLDYVERSLRLLDSLPLSYWIKELAEETLVWSETAKGGSARQRRSWQREGINTFAHNIGSAELYRRHVLGGPAHGSDGSAGAPHGDRSVRQEPVVERDTGLGGAPHGDRSVRQEPVVKRDTDLGGAPAEPLREPAAELAGRERIIHRLIGTHGLIGQQIRGEVPPEVNRPLAALAEEGLLTPEELERLLMALNQCIIAAVAPELWRQVQPEVQRLIAAVAGGGIQPVPLQERLRRMRTGPAARGEDFSAEWVRLAVEGFRPDWLEPLSSATFWYAESALQTFSLEQFLKVMLLIAGDSEHTPGEGPKHISFAEVMNSIYYDYRGVKKINVYKKRIIEKYLSELSWEELGRSRRDSQGSLAEPELPGAGEVQELQAAQHRQGALDVQEVQGVQGVQDGQIVQEMHVQAAQHRQGAHNVHEVQAAQRGQGAYEVQEMQAAQHRHTMQAAPNPHLTHRLQRQPELPDTLFFDFVFSPAAEKLIEFCIEAEKSPLYERAVLMLFDLFGLRRDAFDRFHNEETYLSQMNGTADYKAVILEHIAGTKVLDIGPGGGVLLDLIEERLPGVQAVGIDISSNVIEALQQRKAREKRGWEVLQGDALNLKELVTPGSVDTVVFSSILHELYSYVPFNGRKFNHETVAAALVSAYEVLADSGVIIIRDGIMTEPEHERRRVRFLEEDGLASLARYAEDFAGRRIQYEVIGEQEVLMPVNDAMEFLYTYTWGEEAYVHEVQEQFGYFTPGRYKKFIQSTLGETAQIEVFRHYLQDGYTEALRERIVIMDDHGAEVSLPDSTCFIVIRKG